MKPERNFNGGIGDEEYFNDFHGDYISDYPVNDVLDIKDYGTEHEEADTVITKYVNDVDKAFRELLHMLEQNEPKMEARMIKPFSSENSSSACPLWQSCSSSPY